MSQIKKTSGGPLEYSFPGQIIYWKNLSTQVSDSQVQEVIRAVQVQITRDFFPHWHVNAQLEAWDVNRAYDQWQVVFFDDEAQAESMGYRDLTEAGKPLAKIFVKDSIDRGSRWSVTASHEILEMLVDPYCELSAFNQSTPDSGILYAYEICDPVESDETGYDVGDIRVSNFVLPSWFQPTAKPSYDYLAQLTAPLTLGRNGYMSHFKVGQSDNGWRRDFGPRRRPNNKLPSEHRLRIRSTPKDKRIISEYINDAKY